MVIFGDDIGMWNVGRLHPRHDGAHAQNIDRIAREGMIFTDHDGQPSCTAGRGAFNMGQFPVQEFPQSQGADTLRMKKAIEKAAR